jgi:glycosyltransferase involved in cell wall biosynthesis
MPPDERPPAKAGGLHPIGAASLPPPNGGGLLSDERDPTRLNIGILAYNLDRMQPGGIDYYSFHLIKNLLDIDAKNRYFLIHGEDKELFDKDSHEDIIIGGQGAFGYVRRMIKSLGLGERVDVVHGPYTGTPFGDFKKVITVHDIIPSIQGWHDWKDQIHFKVSTPIMLSIADMIIADSHKTKKDLLDFYRIDDEKIRVVHLGVALRDRPKGTDGPGVGGKTTGGKTILFVSNMKPVKNVETLIRAFGTIAGRIPHNLVLVGMKPKYDAPYKAVKDSKMEDRVVFTGHITDDELAGLYRRSDMFVLPSTYEGFGLPVLEAMGYGVPVISSNAASLPEVVGDAGLLFDPLDFEDLAQEMLKVAESENLRTQLRAKGFERVKQFSWQKTAKETLAVYMEVCGKK